MRHGKKSNPVRFLIQLFIFINLVLLIAGCALPLNLSTLVVFNGKFVRLNDTLYARPTEVTNAEYQKFLRDITIHSPQKLSFCSVDSNLWLQYPGAEPVAKYYFIHPFFQAYPVCCISWEAANEYCKWLTEKLQGKRKQPEIIFRLPDEQEWMDMVTTPDKNGLEISAPGLFDETTNCYRINFWVTDTATNTAEDGGYYTVVTDAYWPNKKGFFNVHGNVAEMTANKMICKGGGWNDSLSNCSVYARKYYPLPSAEVGLRVFAVIRK